MSQTSGVSCGVTFFLNPEKQTNISLGLRVAAAILGVILIIGGILNLCGITGLSQFGTPVGWTVFSLGFFIILAAGLTKCIKKHNDNRQEAGVEDFDASANLPKKIYDVAEALSNGLSTNMSSLVNKKQIQTCKVFVDVKQGENIIFTKDYIISILPDMTAKQMKAYIIKNIMAEITRSFSQDADKTMQMSWGVLTKNPENKNFDFLLLSLEFDLLSTNFTLNRTALKTTLNRVHDYLQEVNANRTIPTWQ